jgi:hypothetical protein
VANRWRSSFFYFFFAIIGGTFSALLLNLFYANVFKILPLFRLFFLKTFLVCLLLQWWIYSFAADSMVAPFTLRELLNNPSAVGASSLLGLLLAWHFLFLTRGRHQIDLYQFIHKERPLIQSLVCCAVGGLFNILFVSAVWYVSIRF